MPNKEKELRNLMNGIKTVRSNQLMNQMGELKVKIE